jgi:hypothetical protein
VQFTGYGVAQSQLHRQIIFALSNVLRSFESGLTGRFIATYNFISSSHLKILILFVFEKIFFFKSFKYFQLTLPNFWEVEFYKARLWYLVLALLSIFVLIACCWTIYYLVCCLIRWINAHSYEVRF